MAYQPAGMTTGSASLQHLVQTYYERRALKPLSKKFMFWKGCDNRVLPKRNGKTIQFFRYSQLGANTTPTTEGEVGTSLTITSSVVTATVSQYADFISFSDLLVDTALDDIVAAGAELLGYRAGLTCDTILRNVVDAVAASIDVALLGSYFTAKDAAGIVARFQGLDIKPFPNGFYPAIAHPYVVYDFVNDPSAAGFRDIVKYLGDDAARGNLEDRGFVARFNDVELWQSTNVTVVGGTPNKYRIYFFGQEGLAAIDLAGRGPTRVQDPEKTQFNVNVIRTEPNPADPEGKIKAYVSYNFVFVGKLLSTSPYRVRKIDAPTSLGL